MAVFVFSILYAHIRDLRHHKRVAQACRERDFNFSIKFLWRDTNNESIIIIICYLIVSLITMFNLIKRLISATFFSTPASDVHER